MGRKGGGGRKGRGREGFGSRPDFSRDQVPGKTPEERRAGPVPPGEVRTTPRAGIGHVPDPTPGDRGHPGVERPDWPLFRDRPPGWKPAPGGVGGGERRDPGAPPDDVGEGVGAQRGATKSGPSGGDARQGGEAHDTRDRTDFIDGGPGDWKNPRQGFGGGHAGRSFGNQPDVKEGDELAGRELEPGGGPAAGREAEPETGKEER